MLIYKIYVGKLVFNYATHNKYKEYMELLRKYFNIDIKEKKYVKPFN